MLGAYSYYVKKAVKILRNDGVSNLARRFNRFLQKRRQRLLAYAKIYYRGTKQKQKYGVSYPDPLKLVWVDPRDINVYLQCSEKTDYCIPEDKPREISDLYEDEVAKFRRRSNLGKIMGGDWDRHVGKLEDRTIYRSLKEVLEGEKDWQDTDFVQRALALIERGYSVNGCSTKDKYLEQRLPFIEKLYADMKKNGYKSQKQVRDGKGLLHEIAVNIGRNGELIFNNETGNHRLCLARMLGIREVPVLVVVRHTGWQGIRNKIQKGEKLSGCSDDLYSHPDLQDVLQ